MACLVDTCGWIEWLVDGALADAYQEYLSVREAVVVPTCVQFELYKWTKRERTEATALEVVALTEQGSVMPLSTSLALIAADQSLALGLSFADAVIYASARAAGVPLITSDSHFERLEGVVFLPKTGTA